MRQSNNSVPARLGSAGSTPSFSDKYFRSARFDEVFQAGMLLVEEASTYLEGEGRQLAQRLEGGLDRDLAFAFATESMRLTTRLMALASWLMIKRAVLNGELSSEMAAQQEQHLKLQTISRLSTAEHFEKLPPPFQNLVLRSLKLHERILCLDKILKGAQQLQATVSDPVV